MFKSRHAFLVVAGIWTAGCSQDAEVDSKLPRSIRFVEAKIEKVDQSLSQVGEIRPHHDTAISFRSGGLLTKRVNVGGIVRTGDVLATLDPTPARNDVRTARTEIASADAAMSLATMVVERQRALVKQNASPRALLEEAEAMVATSTARVEAAKVALDRAEVALSYTEIRAPHAGTVSFVGADQDEVVSAGQVVMQLVSVGQRDAVFHVPEVLYRTAPEDANIALQLVTDPKITARGTVYEVAPAADPATRSFLVKVAIEANGSSMPFGAPVIGTIILSSKPVIKLPASALTNTAAGPGVFVFDNQTEQLQRRSIVLDSFDESFLFVAEGLNPGELVAVAGVSKLRDGEKVTAAQKGA